MSKAIRRAELVLAGLLILAILLPQLLGNVEQTENSGSLRDIATAEDLKDKTASAVAGSSFAVMITELFPDAQINYVNDWADECIQVDQGKSDYLLWESSSLPELYEEYPELVALPEPAASLKSSWCTQKTPEGDKLRQEINTFLAEMQAENQLDALYKKWEDQETAPDHVDSFPMTGADKGVLKIVSCLDWVPMCYLKGEHPCGYVIELLYRFCAWAGYTPEIEYVDIQSALSGFGAGKYDLLGYGLENQPEAAESMYFTDPVATEPVYFVISRSRYAGETGEAEKKQETVSKASVFWSNLMASLEKNFIREDRWKMILSGLGVTLLLSLLSVLFGTMLGGLICFMRLSKRAYPNAFARMYIKFLQGTPIVVLLLVLYYVIFGRVTVSAFWVCVLGLSLDFSAYTAEIFRSGIEAVPEGQIRAAKALGFKPSAAFMQVVLPQMVIHCLPVYMGQLISTVKLSSVAGYISVQDLTKVSDLIRARTYEAFFPLILTAIIYFLVAWLLTLMLKQLEKRIDPKLKRRQVRGVNEDAD